MSKSEDYLRKYDDRVLNEEEVNFIMKELSPTDPTYAPLNLHSLKITNFSLEVI